MKTITKVYGISGLLMILIAETLLFTGNDFMGRWMTPFCWTGYILFIDFLIFSKKGNSLISRSLSGFMILCILSILTWYIFEFYNIFIKNWQYINLPQNRLSRYTGYFWSFATIFPAIFETIELLVLFSPKKRENNLNRTCSVMNLILILTGSIFLIVPLFVHSKYFFPPVWLGFIFLLDPVNKIMGKKSIINEIMNKNFRLTLKILLAGLICGFLWEFWNYWANTKWIYDVPFLPDIKIFEMPALGYLGFPPFALECYIMYTFEITILNKIGFKINNNLDF